MNNKLIKASVAGVAALAIAAGGSTFALWSDYDVLGGSQAGAEELSLVIGEPNSQNFDNMKLAPGVGNDFEFVVASRTGQTIPTADLRMQLTNLQSVEDGCTSANSEDDVDDCESNLEGDFDDEARIIINASQPLAASVSDPCNSQAYPRGSRQTSISLRDLFNAPNPVKLLPAGTYLAPGQQVCVSMGLNMPTSATNASQGDSASFDLKFLLDQVIVPVP